MKPLFILMRIFLVGIFWSILFLEGIRVIMLTNWHFDILRTTHWEHAWKLWLSGWVIDDPKEWAFVLIILTFIPLWLTGWAALSMIHWERLFGDVTFIPLKVFNKMFEKQFKKIADTASVKVVQKKKSYKEIRPRSLRPPMEGNAYSAKPAGKNSTFAPAKPLHTPAPETKPTEFDHSLFKLEDDSPDFDFDLFDEKSSVEPQPLKEEPIAAPRSNGKNRNNKNRNQNNSGKNSSSPRAIQQTQPTQRGSSSSTLDIIKQKGYSVITGITIKNTLIDFIGVSDSQICMCLNDKEPGDWLADEERFNDEEPLWFSESSHRISPVRKIDLARQILVDKLNEADLSFEVEAYVIEQIGNIINAEDMFEIWDNMKINVTRIDRGTPKELKLFAKTLEDATGQVAPDKLEKIKKLIRSIA